MFSFIYQTFFYKPLLNALIILINAVPGHDVGVAVVILTIAVKFMIFPFQHKGMIVQKKIKKIEPEVDKIKKEHKSDPQIQSQKIMALYKEHGINPFAGFVGMLIQIPVIIALYRVFMSGLDFDLEKVYSFVIVPSIDIVQTKFLGLIDLTQTNYVLATLAGISQFFQISFSNPFAGQEKVKQDRVKEDFKGELMKNMGTQMKYIMPFFVFFVVLKFTAIIGLYWTTMNVFAIIHELIVRNKSQKLLHENSNRYNKKLDRGSIEKDDNGGGSGSYGRK